jgi:hypothetical protein
MIYIEYEDDDEYESEGRAPGRLLIIVLVLVLLLVLDNRFSWIDSKRVEDESDRHQSLLGDHP